MNRTYMKTGLFAVLVMVLIMPPACAQDISIEGSTTVQPIAEQCAIAYMLANPGSQINVSGGGSSHGIQAVSDGTADIGMASRDLTAAEITDPDPDLVTHGIALDAVDAIVHPANPVTSLTTEQLQGIFCTCTITNWNQVGGNDAPIEVYTRPADSGTRASFEDGIGCTISGGTVVDSNGAMHANVSGNENAIGYISHGYDDEYVKDVNRVSSRTLYMITKGEPDAGDEKNYLEFVLSACGQCIVVDEGFVPIAPRGDLNADDIVNMDDAIYLAKYFFGFPGYCGCTAICDIDCDGDVDMDDAIWLAKHFFGFPGYETIPTCP